MFHRQNRDAQHSANYKTFMQQADLDTEKHNWKTFIETLSLQNVLHWISGKLQPPRNVRQAVLQQRNAMFSALKLELAATSHTHLSSALKYPEHKWLVSDLRGFEHQNTIWKRKYEFHGHAFGIISQHARTICEGLVMPDEMNWLPDNKLHRIGWGVARGSLPQMHTSKLTVDERQLEILQTSSAPGISRHHWGTDFDIFSLETTDWEQDATLLHVYTWLLHHAKTYGFVQPFIASSGGYGKGYQEERWHWSYYPISQALLEFALTHQDDVENTLSVLWQEQVHFSFIRKKWREYMFNINPDILDGHLFRS